MGFVLQLGRATARWCGTLPGSMKAYARMDADTQTVQRVEAGVPEVGDEQVRVQMHALGVGIHDRYFISPTGPFPYVIGIEGAGVVAEPG